MPKRFALRLLVEVQSAFKVKASISNTACRDVEVSTNGSTLSLTCTVSNVYPDIDCAFRKTTDYTGAKISPNHIEIQRATTEGDHPPRTVHHNYTCTMNLPVSKPWGIGLYTIGFHAQLVSWSETKAWISTFSNAFRIMQPYAELTNCPNTTSSNRGYIKEMDNTRTCECRLLTSGTIISGVPQWRDESGDLVDEEGLLPLVYNPDDPTPTFTCRTISVLGEGYPVTYSPRFAYGPNAINVSFDTESDTVNKCKNNTLTTYCDIAVDSVSAEPRTFVTANDQSHIERLSNMSTETYYRHVFSVTPGNGGNLTLSCDDVDDNDGMNVVVIGLIVGRVVAVVLAGVLCLVLVKDERRSSNEISDILSVEVSICGTVSTKFKERTGSAVVEK